MKLIVPISGGKDSQATLLYCIEKYGVENLIAVFCDTKWEHEITYKHLDYLVKKTGIEYHILSSETFDGFLDLCKRKKRFPSSQVGFCTTELKIIPMIDFVLSLEDNVIIFQGIRKDESRKRSQMTEQCRYFKFYFEPYLSNEMIVSQFNENPPTTHKQKLKLQKAVDRLAKGKNDEKFHTYRKKDIIEWCSKYADDIQRPFIDATADEVIYYSLNRQFEINKLYFMGTTRVGCFPCKNATHPEMKIIIEKFPETLEKLKSGEKYVGSTFFAPDYIPKRYHTGFDPKSQKTICKIEDVVRYISDKNVQLSMLNELEMDRGCQSVYAICE